MKILVTGGAGSIGSEVVRRLVSDGHFVRVMDINEESLWSLRCELPDIDVRLSDVCNAEWMMKAMDGMDRIVHCAAAKHIDLCESSPEYAEHINVGGMASLANARFNTNKNRPCVVVSTDKAIMPESVMGRTKEKAERVAIGIGCNVVRFGNVIGTRGSLVPMVQRCAQLGRPIPLTDPNMTRWMMGVDEAVELIYEALFTDERGRTFGPARPQAVNIGRFVEVCRDELAPDCQIVKTGMRPGERLHEPMQLRNGSTVWSKSPEHAMSEADMLHLIEQAVAA